MMRPRIRRSPVPLGALAVALVLAPASGTRPAGADSPKIGINVLLSDAPSDASLEALGQYGSVLEVIPEIRAVTLRAAAEDLETIAALDGVESATPDAVCEPAGSSGLPVADLSDGGTCWNLDAIDVAESGGGRTVDEDGTGVYVAIVDSGLPHNWRSYFPEERVAAEFGRAFGGGGGENATVSSQPEKWAHDTDGHGTTIASVILGFAYEGDDDQMPAAFGGVAPCATLIPVRVQNAMQDSSGAWESQIAQAIVYVARLKAEGDLGDAPLVISLSSGLPRPLPMERAAIGFAIEQGAIVVVSAGNDAAAGMRYPAAYPEVISVAAVGPVGEFPADDPGNDGWILEDLPEDDASPYFVAPFSSRPLAGQDLDVTAPGFPVPTAWTLNGKAEYSYAAGTSQACPHVSGVVALMLQKNPSLTQAEVEEILESSALALPGGSATVRWPSIDHAPVAAGGGHGYGDFPTWDDDGNVAFFDLTVTWDDGDAGAGLVQADAALAATPEP